jgi:signal peptidase I
MEQSVYSPRCAIASQHLQIEETGRDVVVFDTERQAFHFLNPTAYSIFKACNGFNSITDIAVMLCEQFHCDDMASVVDDVTATLTDLRDKGLVAYVVDDPQLQQVAADSSTEGQLLAVSVTGTSMFPVLLSGDKVLVKKSAIEELADGDIVVWSNDSLQRIAHRALSIEASATPPLITTKGDLCLDPDPPVEFDRVLGKIVAVVREGKVRWMKELDKKAGGSPDNGEVGGQTTDQPANGERPKRKPSYQRMMVLDLRDISAESILNIESVEQISLVLLSPENAHAWSDVPARDVKAVITAPRGHRVYTGQPELLPEMLEFLGAPLRLVVSGQLFLTAFEPGQISKALDELILNGQAYVSSAEAKAELESVANILSGEICVVPAEHARWIGQSILGPEYLSNSPQQPLVAVGELTVSTRVKEVPDGTQLFNLNGAKR